MRLRQERRRLLDAAERRAATAWLEERSNRAGQAWEQARNLPEHMRRAVIAEALGPFTLPGEEWEALRRAQEALAEALAVYHLMTQRKREDGGAGRGER